VDRPLTEPPPRGREARFGRDFAPCSLLTVDTEEEFDWSGKFSARGHGLDHVPRLQKFQEFCEGIGVSPVYLIDWPIVTCDAAVEIIGAAVNAGKAEVGIQLHPWVNPPHDEEVCVRNSFAGNLPAPLERAKFLRLRDEIARRFGTAPQIYRAGRYGLGPNSGAMLRDAGVAVDSSVRARFDYRVGHGPDYSRHPVKPYWTDKDRRLLELPLTTVFTGALGRWGKRLFPFTGRIPRLRSLLARTGMLERISLTPEGVGAAEAVRGIDAALAQGLPVLVLSFHSPSLAPGHTPYVRNDDDLDELYDWLRHTYAHLRARGVRPATVREILAATRP